MVRLPSVQDFCYEGSDSTTEGFSAIKDNNRAWSGMRNTAHHHLVLWQHMFFCSLDWINQWVPTCRLWTTGSPWDFETWPARQKLEMLWTTCNPYPIPEPHVACTPPVYTINRITFVINGQCSPNLGNFFPLMLGYAAATLIGLLWYVSPILAAQIWAARNSVSCPEMQLGSDTSISPRPIYLLPPSWMPTLPLLWNSYLLSPPDLNTHPNVCPGWDWLTQPFLFPRTVAAQRSQCILMRQIICTWSGAKVSCTFLQHSWPGARNLYRPKRCSGLCP